MTEDQAFEAIKNIIRLETLSRETSAKVSKQIREVFAEAKREVSQIDPTDPLREQRLIAVLAGLALLFRAPNDRLYLELNNALRVEVGKQTDFAARFIDAGEEKPVVADLEQSPSSPLLQSQVDRNRLLEIVAGTTVLGLTLGEIFGITKERSHFIDTQLKRIDKAVKKGFLTGDTAEEIAESLTGPMNSALRDAKAISTTAVMDMSHQAHNAEWDSNESEIAMWEYDATMDYKVCELCYVHDGKRAETRAKLIAIAAEPLVHPNCRCNIWPLTEAELEQEDEDIAAGQTRQIFEVNEKASDATGRVYKRRERRMVNDKSVMMTRSTRELKAKPGKRVTMGDFIAQTTPDTRRQVLGPVRAAEFEYLIFSNRGPKLKDVDAALIRVTRADGRQLQKAQRARAKRRKN